MSIIFKKEKIVDVGLITRDLTLAEYEALPDSKLTDGVYYNIIDSNTMPDAEEIQGDKNFLGSVKVKGKDVVTNGLKSMIIEIGNVSVTSNNYLKLWESSNTNMDIVSVKLAYWSQNSDVFNVVPYQDQQIYLIAKNGFSVQSLRLKVFYIDKE